MTGVTDSQRIELMLAETEVRTIEILIEYCELSPQALARLRDSCATIREALAGYRGTLQ